MSNLIRLILGVLIIVSMNIVMHHRRETTTVSVSASAQ